MKSYIESSKARKETYNGSEISDASVVHERIFPKYERMVVYFHDGRETGISDVSQRAFGCGMSTKLAKCKIGRNRGNSPKLSGLHAFDGGVEFCEGVGIPTHPEAVNINPRSLCVDTDIRKKLTDIRK